MRNTVFLSWFSTRNCALLICVQFWSTFELPILTLHEKIIVKLVLFDNYEQRLTDFCLTSGIYSHDLPASILWFFGFHFFFRLVPSHLAGDACWWQIQFFHFKCISSQPRVFSYLWKKFQIIYDIAALGLPKCSNIVVTGNVTLAQSYIMFSISFSVGKRSE